jgi:hypothetical protein
MILLFDEGGDKIVSINGKGIGVGKFKVNKIWATDLTGMAGTRVDKYDSVEEALLDLAKKGPACSPDLFSDKGIEVARYSGSEKIDGGPAMVYVERHRASGNPCSIKKVGNIELVPLEEFKKHWNNYKNTGISCAPTAGWEDNT